MQWLKDNKDALTVVLSTLAFLISIATFFRSWQRDRRDAAKALQAKSPRISIRTERAVCENLYIPISSSLIPGWDFYIHFEIENRFGVSFTIQRISATEPKGAKVRLHQPISDGFRKHDEDPTDLLGDTSAVYFKPTQPGGVLRPAFHLHIARMLTVEDVKVGVPITLTFDFELQEEVPKREVIKREFVLRPGIVSARN